MKFLWVISFIPLLYLLLKDWNILGRRYNHAIIARAACRSCDLQLGHDCIKPAREKWLADFKSRSNEGGPKIQMSNLELRCPHCGTVNYERDIYAAHKSAKLGDS